MQVLVIGATGYIGSAVCAALRACGRLVVDGPADPLSLATAAGSVDAVVYAVDHETDGAREALRALVDALAGTERPFVFTSGCWYYGPTGEQPVNEQAPANPPAFLARVPELERIVLDGAARGIRSVVIRPGTVYGNGGGLPALWTNSARVGGAARYVGAGENHWPVVHVDDLADLYVRVLERGRAREVFNAADSTTYRVRAMAEAASRGVGGHGRTASWAVADARETLGPVADAMAIDQRIWSARARERLDWRPRSSTILDDLERGSYAGG